MSRAFSRNFAVLPAQCTPRIYPLTECTIPAFYFSDEADPHLPIPEGWKAELACSRREVHFLTENGHFAFLSPPFLGEEA